MKAFLFFILAGLTTGVVAQEIKQFDLEPYSSLYIKGPFEVEISKSNQLKLEMRGHEDIVRNTRIELRNGRLEIIYESNKWLFNNTFDRKTSIILTYNQLEEIYASGASTIEVNTAITGNKLYLECSGASDISANVAVNQLYVELSGASNANLEGEVNEFKGSLSGASDLKASDLQANDVYINASGASDARITANVSIEADASGASDIYYYGSPERVIVDASGASSIKRRQ